MAEHIEWRVVRQPGPDAITVYGIFRDDEVLDSLGPHQPGAIVQKRTVSDWEEAAPPVRNRATAYDRSER